MVVKKLSATIRYGVKLPNSHSTGDIIRIHSTIKLINKNMLLAQYQTANQTAQKRHTITTANSKFISVTSIK
jgi:hypothetical protein